MIDTTQAVGKIPINVLDPRSDIIPFTFHKFNVPKAIGGLYISPAVKIKLDLQTSGGN